MDWTQLAGAAQGLLQGHGRDAALLVAGAALSNPGTCALLLFTALTKIPGVGYWIGKHPDQAKAWADGFDKKIDELVDKYAAQKPSPAAPAPAPASPQAGGADAPANK